MLSLNNATPPSFHIAGRCATLSSNTSIMLATVGEFQGYRIYICSKLARLATLGDRFMSKRAYLAN